MSNDMYPTENTVAAPPLLTPRQVADRLGLTRTWVYLHADELGAIRVGGGPKARLRFRPDVVDQALAGWNDRTPPAAA
jgi:hypothetical protein